MILVRCSLFTLILLAGFFREAGAVTFTRTVFSGSAADPAISLSGSIVVSGSALAIIPDGTYQLCSATFTTKVNLGAERSFSAFLDIQVFQSACGSVGNDFRLFLHDGASTITEIIPHPSVFIEWDFWTTSSYENPQNTAHLALHVDGDRRHNRIERRPDNYYWIEYDRSTDTLVAYSNASNDRSTATTRFTVTGQSLMDRFEMPFMSVY